MCARVVTPTWTPKTKVSEQETRALPVFTPPTELANPPIYVGGPDAYRPVPNMSQRLFRYYRARPAGKTIYKLADGSYTESQPGTYLDASVYPADEATVLVTYLGGHSYNVTAAEAAALTTAGYGSYIT